MSEYNSGKISMFLVLAGLTRPNGAHLYFPPQQKQFIRRRPVGNSTSAIRTTMLKAISILAALGTSVLASNCEVICILFYCFFVCWPARQSHFSLQSTSLLNKMKSHPTSRDCLYCSFLNLQADQFQCNDGTCISLEQR